MQSFVHSFVHSFMNSYSHSFILLFIDFIIHSLSHSVDFISFNSFSRTGLYSTHYFFHLRTYFIHSFRSIQSFYFSSFHSFVSLRSLTSSFYSFIPLLVVLLYECKFLVFRHFIPGLKGAFIQLVFVWYDSLVDFIAFFASRHRGRNLSLMAKRARP